MNDRDLLNAIRAIVREELATATQPLTHIERKLTYLLDERTADGGANYSGVENMTDERLAELGAYFDDTEVPPLPEGLEGFAAARAALPTPEDDTT